MGRITKWDKPGASLFNKLKLLNIQDTLLTFAFSALNYKINLHIITKFIQHSKLPNYIKKTLRTVIYKIP